MKKYSFVHNGIYVTKTPGMGRGVFTKLHIPTYTIIEIAPVLVMSDEDRKLLDQTLLHDYIFEWGKKKDKCCMALGYVPLYNHSYASNCEYEMDFQKKIIQIKTMEAIEAGSELFINYNGDWDNKTPVWFDAK